MTSIVAWAGCDPTVNCLDVASSDWDISQLEVTGRIRPAFENSGDGDSSPLDALALLVRHESRDAALKRSRVARRPQQEIAPFNPRPLLSLWSEFEKTGGE